MLATAAAESYRLAAQVQLWLDQPDQALLELENGIRRCPDDSGLHLDLQVAQHRELALGQGTRRRVPRPR